MDPFIIVPPEPTTSKSNVPPASVSAPLITTFPPELGAIPKVPELIVNDAAVPSEIVSKSPANTVPGVV